jgi:SAM-dependent methyltransferase
MGLFIRFLLNKIFKLGLLPIWILTLIYRSYFLGQKIFAQSSIVRESSNLFSVSPMPSEEELQHYYASVYWSWRGPKNLVTNRDIEQYNLINEHVSIKDVSMLNFGAGPGGISYLFWAAGSEVVNIEPSGIKSPVRKRWQTFTNKEGFSGTVDILASSHSLEHVTDLEATMQWMYDSLAEDGLIFIEVPNSVLPENGGMNGSIIVPHTYYFTLGFFTNLPFEIIHLETYKELGDGFHIKAKDEGGEVIRFLGRKGKCL